MTTTTTSNPPAAEARPDAELHEHDHPSDWMYVKVALILGLLTALEVSTYFIEEASTTLLVGVLFPMMILKFGIVIMYFMHLKYDNPLFKRVFLFGLFLAAIVFTIMLTAMEFWSSTYLRFLR